MGCCAFSLNDEILVTGSNDRTFNIWKLSGSLVNDPRVTEKAAKPLSKLTYDELLDKLKLSKVEAQRILRKQKSSVKISDTDEEIPEEFICPITQDVMRNPVLCSDGYIYEKAAIEEWLISRRKTSPMTNLPMTSTKMELQSELLTRIRHFCHRQI